MSTVTFIFLSSVTIKWQPRERLGFEVGVTSSTLSIAFLMLGLVWSFWVQSTFVIVSTLWNIKYRWRIMWGRKCCLPCRESNQSHYIFQFVTSSVHWPSNTSFLWLSVIIIWFQKLRKESLHSTAGQSSSKQTAIYAQYQTLGPLHAHKVTFRCNLSFVNFLT